MNAPGNVGFFKTVKSSVMNMKRYNPTRVWNHKLKKEMPDGTVAPKDCADLPDKNPLVFVQNAFDQILSGAIEDFSGEQLTAVIYEIKIGDKLISYKAQGAIAEFIAELQSSLNSISRLTTVLKLVWSKNPNALLASLRELLAPSGTDDFALHLGVVKVFVDEKKICVRHQVTASVGKTNPYFQYEFNLDLLYSEENGLSVRTAAVSIQREQDGKGETYPTTNLEKNNYYGYTVGDGNGDKVKVTVDPLTKPLWEDENMFEWK